MRNHKQIPLFLVILTAYALTGCIATPEVETTPNPTLAIPTQQPSPSTTPNPTPTTSSTSEPDFLFSSITILEEPDLGGISILGFIKNNTPHGVTEVMIGADLYIQEEGEIIRKEIPLPQVQINSHEEIPFLIHFPDQHYAEKAVIEVASFQISGYEEAELELEISESFSDADRKQILLGWITNSGSNPAKLYHLQILVLDSAQTPIALESETNHPTSILPGQKIPFLIQMDYAPKTETLQIFTDAISIPEVSTASFSFPQKVEAVLDSQGNILVRGIIRNENTDSRWVAAILALKYQGQMVSLAPLNLPSPLTPGESRAFGLTNFPGWRQRLNQLAGKIEDLSIEIYFDFLGCPEFKGKIINLDLEITSYESTGSTVVLKGTIRNPSSDPLSFPAVQAEMWTTSGKLQTASWTIVDEMIAEGQSSIFVLSLRLPEETQLEEMEIDVRGTGISEESDLPF